MKTPYYNYNGIHVACIFKSGSSAIARAIHFALKPDYQIISASGNADMVERVMHNPGWQAMAPKTFEPISPLIPVRDPVERFRSACAQEGKTAEEALNLLDEGEASQHFRKQSDYLIGDCTLYKFPEHIAELATEIGLDGIPEVNTSETNNGPKPDLTPEQLARVEALYADDIALYESITEAGQVYVVEPEPKPLASLSERLRAVVGAFPPELRAGFPFERVAYWLDQGDNETARAVIADVDTSNFPQAIQDAQAALLAEFDK
jgi:hypothetical protein